MQKLVKFAIVALVIGLLPTIASAENPAPKKTETALQAPAADGGMNSIGKGLACLGAGVAAIGGGFAVARIGGNCLESMARQPEAASSMFAPMIVTAAMVEGGMLFAIVVCLLGVLG